MGKRSDFERRERDFYPTPYAAVTPLLPHLRPGTRFDEPCAGDGAIVRHLKRHNHLCVAWGDIEPRDPSIPPCSIFDVVDCEGTCFITNTPWPRPGQQGEPTTSMALHLSNIAPTWLLLSADFAHNKYFTKLAPRCHKIVSVGRVSWMENGVFGVDNCAWYLFDKHADATTFYGRTAR